MTAFFVGLALAAASGLALCLAVAILILEPAVLRVIRWARKTR